jgi:hypothetical protein
MADDKKALAMAQAAEMQAFAALPENQGLSKGAMKKKFKAVKTEKAKIEKEAINVSASALYCIVLYCNCMRSIIVIVCC